MHVLEFLDEFHTHVKLVFTYAHACMLRLHSMSCMLDYVDDLVVNACAHADMDKGIHEHSNESSLPFARSTVCGRKVNWKETVARNQNKLTMHKIVEKSSFASCYVKF